MPTVIERQVEPLLEPVHQVERQPLVDRHRGVAEGEVVVVERGELHRVLEQARPGGEAGARHVGGPRVVLGQALADALEVEPAVVGHHVELVGGRELDVAPHVGEELRELGLLGRQLHDAVGQQRRTAWRPAPGRAACGRRRSAAARTARSSPCPRRSAPGRTRPRSRPRGRRSSSPPARSRRGRRWSAAPAAGRRAGTARSRRARSGIAVLVGVQVLVDRCADDHDDVLGGCPRSAGSTMRAAVRRQPPARALRRRQAHRTAAWPRSPYATAASLTS